MCVSFLKNNKNNRPFTNITNNMSMSSLVQYVDIHLALSLLPIVMPDYSTSDYYLNAPAALCNLISACTH